MYLSMEQRRCTCPWNNEGAVRKENCFFLMVMSRGKKTKSTTDKPQTVFIYVCVILPLPQTVQTHLHVNTCSVSIFPSSVLAFCPHQHTCWRTWKDQGKCSPASHRLVVRPSWPWKDMKRQHIHRPGRHRKRSKYAHRYLKSLWWLEWWWAAVYLLSMLFWRALVHVTTSCR